MPRCSVVPTAFGIIGSPFHQTASVANSSVLSAGPSASPNIWRTTFRFRSSTSV